MHVQKFELILFDTIGTTVKESVEGKSLIIESFRKAFAVNGIQVTAEAINHQRGKSKREAIRNILPSYEQSEVLATKIYNDFMDLVCSKLSYFSAIEGATEVFSVLRQKGIKIGLGSGLPMDFMKALLNHLGWEPDNFDYIGSSDELGKGRPDPIMILDAQDRLNIKDKKKVLKIGDTFVDIQEGKNAGVVTAAVLTGTQRKAALQKYQPDYIFSDIQDLLKVL